MALADRQHPTGEYLEEMTARLWRLAAVAGLGFALVGVGYWYTQIVRAPHYRELSEHNRLRQAPIKAPRGLIEDRRGRLLVENIPAYNLLFDRTLAAGESDSLTFAAGLLGTPQAELEAELEAVGSRSRFVPVVLAEDLDLSQVARFEVASLEHPEFQVEVLHRRLYRYGAQTAHLLGYLGEVTASDLERSAERFEAGDLMGKEGIEQRYDAELRGKDGRRVVVVDSRGRTIEEYRRDPSRPGLRLQLTVDLDLQQHAQLLLGEQVGAVVALDPRDGAIRVLLSAPSFDPNAFARRLDQSEWQSLLESPNHVLQNRAIHNAFPPGSVFKIAIAMAGLAEGVTDPDRRVFCSGSARFYNRRRRCWRAGGHGWVDLHQAIKESCDIYFYTIGQELGIEKIAEYARRFGLGRPSGIDLAGERAGLVPDPEWSRRVRRSPWYPGETLSVAIGQGALLVTPLQVAVMMAAVANGGGLVVPYLVQGEAQPPRGSELDPEDLERVRQALIAVVNAGGSGRVARVEGLRIAGKTGTAQVIEQRTRTKSESLPYDQRDHAWFASFAPADAPELVIVVFVEHGGSGSRAAAPIARELYERYLQNRSDDAI